MSTTQDDEQDLTRKQRREQARAERKQLEENERLSARRRRRLIQVGATLVVAAVIAVVAVLVATGGGKKHTETASTGAGVTAGIQSTPAPWPPAHAGLTTRVAALHLPGQSDTAYHIHAALRVYVNAHQVPVPADIGINPEEEFLAPVHTHDSSGIIHMEASEQYPFTLSQLFTIWGVTFSSTQLGSYVAGNGNALAVYVNGSPVTNFVGYVMRSHDNIVVAYGKPGSFPTSFQYPWAANPGL